MAAGKRLALACAAVASLGCVVLSLILILKIGFLGFAIGGWTGLKDYEQSIVDARNTQKAAGIQLLLLQGDCQDSGHDEDGISRFDILECPAPMLCLTASLPKPET